MAKEIRFRSIWEDMNRTGLELPKIWPIRVTDHTNRATWTAPSLSTVWGISDLWIVLGQIVDDWQNHAKSYSYSDYEESGYSRTDFTGYAFEELRPRFVQCLFSYVSFFFLLENGFRVMHTDLKKLKGQLNLNIKTGKRPARGEYIEKLQRVRNFTVVHWGGA